MLHKFSHIIYGAMFLSLFALSAPINADENPISPAPAVDIQATHTETPNIAPAPFAPRLNLAPNETHSGLRLPRWVSLKYGDVNGRKGPGKTYPHLWTFQRKGMPVIVVNEMDHWRKIRDIEGGESWVRSVALSGYNTAIVTQKTPLRKNTKVKSRILAQIEPNVLLKISECDHTYCLVEIDTEIPKGKKKGPKGYVLRANIWGAENF